MKIKQEKMMAASDSDEVSHCRKCRQPIAKEREFCVRCGNLEAHQGQENQAPNPNRKILIISALLIIYGLISTSRSVKNHFQRVAAEREAEEREAVHISELENERAELSGMDAQGVQEGALQMEEDQNLQKITVVCPACEGRRRLAFEHKPARSYTCPLCNGSGKGTRRFRSDRWELCDQCEGMGGVLVKDNLFRTNNRMVRDNCSKCGGRGLLPK